MQYLGKRSFLAQFPAKSLFIRMMTIESNNNNDTQKAKRVNHVKMRYFAALNLMPTPTINIQESPPRNDSPIYSEPTFSVFKQNMNDDINFDIFNTPPSPTRKIRQRSKSRGAVSEGYNIPSQSSPIPVPIASNNIYDDWDETSFIPPHLLVDKSDELPYKKKKTANFAF